MTTTSYDTELKDDTRQKQMTQLWRNLVFNSLHLNNRGTLSEHLVQWTCSVSLAEVPILDADWPISQEGGISVQTLALHWLYETSVS